MPVRELVHRALPGPLHRAIHHKRVRRAVKNYEPRLVTHDFGGHPLTVELADPLSEGWYDHDWVPLPEAEPLKRLGALGPDKFVFDIGAHQGVVALMLGKDAGEVLAVEAEAHNAQVAERNVARNGGNVTVVHAAIAAKSGTIRFAEGLNGQVAAGALGSVEVPAVTIDELAETHGVPDLVFLDVEGYEGKALEGAGRTLANTRTAWCVEVHVGKLVDCTAREIVERFDGFDRHCTDGLEDKMFRPYTGQVPGEQFFLIAVP